MDNLVKELKDLKIHHERIQGAQKLGLGSHYWNGRAQGVQDAIELIQKREQLNEQEGICECY